MKKKIFLAVGALLAFALFTQPAATTFEAETVHPDPKGISETA